MSEGIGSIHSSQLARKHQVITFAYWAIKEILDEQHVSALAELTAHQRSGQAIAPAAAKLAAIEEIRFAFVSQLIKEPTPHAS